MRSLVEDDNQDNNNSYNIEVAFDPLPIILGVAGILAIILMILCFCAIKKALDIANRDKVIVFEGTILLTEDQMQPKRSHGKNTVIHIAQEQRGDNSPIYLEGEIQIGPVSKPNIENI